MTPFILTSDVLLVQAWRRESVRLALNKLWPSFLLLLTLFIFSLFSWFMLQVITPPLTMFLVIICLYNIFDLIKRFFLFQGLQLWDLLVHTQPFYCLLYHPNGAHGWVGWKWAFLYFCFLHESGMTLSPLLVQFVSVSKPKYMGVLKKQFHFLYWQTIFMWNQGVGMLYTYLYCVISACSCLSCFCTGWLFYI